MQMENKRTRLLEAPHDDPTEGVLVLRVMDVKDGHPSLAAHQIFNHYVTRICVADHHITQNCVAVDGGKTIGDLACAATLTTCAWGSCIFVVA